MRLAIDEKPTTAKLAETYDKAAQIVRTRGIIKGNYSDDWNGSNADTCHVCAVGAAGVAYVGTPNALGQIEEWLVSPLEETLRLRGIDEVVVDWNDLPETTAEDVAKLFTDTAARLRDEQ